MNAFFDGPYCRTRRLCQACRTNPVFQTTMRQKYPDLPADFACPFGVTDAALRQGVVPPPPAGHWRGLGDVIASATKAVGIKPCGGCKKRQAKLNALVPFGPGAGGAEPAKMTGSKV